VERNFLPGGKYEFMKRPEDRAAADVVTMGYLQLRPAHWFEKEIDSGDDLYGPPSLVFAGAIARADDAQGIAQGPVGSRFGQVVGSEKCRIEPLIGEMEHLSMERQLIPIIRDADNHLCFFGCRTQAEDPYGVLKFFTSYRILRYLERCCRHYLLQVAGQVLTRDFMDEQIEKPLKRLLDEQVEQGTILGYELSVDKDSNKRMQGICDITLNVMPTGPAETFVLKIDVPEFAKSAEKK
jgi:phage tail sheath protein FI